jgi:hypothetical protein
MILEVKAVDPWVCIPGGGGALFVGAMTVSCGQKPRIAIGIESKHKSA